jgi:tetratricopeptide (TPR) repeat protein
VSGALRTAAKVRALGGRAKTRQDADPAVVACHELVHAEMLADAALIQAGSGASGAEDARKMIHEALRLVNQSLTLRIDVGATALTRIALAQAKLGEVAQSRETFARALEVTGRIEGFQRPETMAQIAEARWQAGETAEARVILRHALERARPLKDQFPQVDNLIVEVQIKAGDLDGALETARASHRERAELVLNPEVLRQLVRARAAKIGPRPALEEWWKSVQSPLARAYVLLGAAEAAANGIPKPPVQP